MRHPFFDPPPPLVFGHRGAAGEAPENTLPSFRLALEAGASVIESDVHCCRDGTPVLIHDPTVERTTDGRGRVAELTLDALRHLDAGRGAFRGQGIRVPTLAEAFAALPDVRFNLELKQACPEAVASVLDAVAAAGREALTLLTVEADEGMAELRTQVASRGSRVALGASRGEVLGFLRAAASGSPPPSGPMALQLPSSHEGRDLVSAGLVRLAHAHGVPVHVFTVNAVEEIERLLDLGVDGIVTDFPARAVAVVRRRRSG
jgi:glycerophosphoryl diester phosphodiesterase